MYIANKQQSQCITAAVSQEGLETALSAGMCCFYCRVSLLCLLSVVAWSVEALMRRDEGTIVLISLAWPLRDCARARLDCQCSFGNSTPASGSAGTSEVQGQGR